MRRIRKGDVKTETRPALSPFDRSFGSDFRERHPSPLRTLELAGQVRDGRRWKINGELHWDGVKMDSTLFSRAALSYRCIPRASAVTILRRHCLARCRYPRIRYRGYDNTFYDCNLERRVYNDVETS